MNAHPVHPAEAAMPLKLVIANKAYSSWSLRPWILLAHFKIPFEEIVIPMDLPTTRKQMLAHAPTGKCPSLHDGAISVWESLAIVEYVAEKYPDKAIWPRARTARAYARSLSSEMHAGFQALRQHCPTNFRRPVRKLELTECAVEEVGVHHYPRLHGRSQFFRVKSLARTLAQLLRLWSRLVLIPWIAREEPAEVPVSSQ